MKTLLTNLWELFFPRCCLLCGKPLISGENDICTRCLIKLPRTGYHLQEGNEVERNFWGKFPIGRATSFLHYIKEGPTQQLVHDLKYHGYKEVGETMGRIMAVELLPSGFFDGIDLIHPVPLHPRKERQRGYNQSERLAAGLSAITGIPVCNHAIQRIKYTETQTRKGNYERWENVEEIFSCATPEMLAGKHILIIDDVLTTGATIVACADALRDVPQIRISVLTLAVAGHT